MGAAFSHREFLRWALVVLAVAVAVAAWRLIEVRAWISAALAWIEDLGIWGPVFYILLYMLFTVCLVPGSPMTVGGGAAFGVVFGTILGSLAATLGATCAFLISRYCVRGWVERSLRGRPMYAAIDEAVARDGWKIVMLTRLSPVFPFVILNYAFGLTQVSLRHYVLASWVGMLPGSALYAYFGSLARASAEAHELSRGEWVLYLFGLMATVAVTVSITRVARRALRRGEKVERSLN
ncbi:MAG: TVP38/TMEM64 family protein [Verrucomicrobia bacterium]|nr:TVP38/TMEM64 family protein [Verrucomicrobiota bacterium]